jgi:hypothetical protein
MWFKDHLRLILKICGLLVLLVIAVIPKSNSVIFENRFFTTLDSSSTGYINDALVRAASAYALSRTFNGVVSVVQESHLQIQPAGVGVSLALGEILDPINDLVERFSGVMLVSLAALGIQKALVVIGPWFSLKILLPLALGLLLLGYLPFGKWARKSTHLGKVLIVSVILVRFAVPVMAFLNQQVYLSVLEETHNKAIGKVSQEIDLLKEEVPMVNGSQAPSSQSRPQNLWDKTKDALNRTVDQGKEIMAMQDKINKLKSIAAESIDRIIDLIVVFVLNTIVLPLLFLWAIAKLGRIIATENREILQQQP